MKTIRMLSNPKIINSLIDFFRINKDDKFTVFDIHDRTDIIFSKEYNNIMSYGRVRNLISFLSYHGVIVKVLKVDNGGFWQYNPSHTYTYTV